MRADATTSDVKLAQRNLVPLALWERDGERGTGMAGFIHRGGIFTMPVKYYFRFKYYFRYNFLLMVGEPAGIVARFFA